MLLPQFIEEADAIIRVDAIDNCAHLMRRPRMQKHVKVIVGKVSCQFGGELGGQVAEQVLLLVKNDNTMNSSAAASGFNPRSRETAPSQRPWESLSRTCLVRVSPSNGPEQATTIFRKCEPPLLRFVFTSGIGAICALFMGFLSGNPSFCADSIKLSCSWVFPRGQSCICEAEGWGMPCNCGLHGVVVFSIPS